MPAHHHPEQSQLRIVDGHFAFEGGPPLLTAIDVHVISGFTGVVGPNGSGKTTLLRLLAGVLDLGAGHRHASFDGGDIAICAQRVDAPDALVESFGLRWDREAMRLRARLGLDPDELERWTSLSAGERKRWQVGAALARRPAALFLDEPTNNLDAETRHQLLDALRRYRGIGIVVSHDRALLSELTHTTLVVERGRVDVYAGDYDGARATRAHDARAAQEARRTTVRAERRLRKAVHQKRNEHASSVASLSTRQRMKSPKDSDARSAVAKGRVAHAEGSLARELAALTTRLARAEQETARTIVHKEYRGAFHVATERSSKRRVAHLDAGAVTAGTRTLFRMPSLMLSRGDRVRLEGANGAGKSTLMRRIASQATAYHHLPQELSATAGDELLTRLRNDPPAERGRWLSLAVRLGVDADAVLASACPSPGEARKLWLARALTEPRPLLLLDEPENHLDLATVEQLEDALSTYDGALVLVSHDARFAEGITTTTWRIAKGALTESIGEARSIDPAS